MILSEPHQTAGPSAAPCAGSPLREQTSVPVVAMLRANRALACPVLEGEITPESLRRYGTGVPGGRALVFADAIAWMHHGARLKNSLQAVYCAAEVVLIDAGEAAKSWDSLWNILERMSTMKLDRRVDALYAVGGGSVLDLVGLAASIYRRGVPLAKIPTTVMAQVDAAVGLKNAINFEGAKNLVGSFAPPHSVFVDYELLASLPKRHVANGVSEIVKLGLMLDDGLIGDLMALPASRWPDSRREFDGILRNAIAGIVDELSINPYEASLSRPLDFGHWLSPQLEMDDPNLLHGEAVAIDMAITLVMSAHRKLMQDSNVAALLDILDDWGLPTWHAGVTPDLVEDSLARTCSHRGGQQNIPLCTGIGMHLIVHDISCQEVMAAVQRLGSRLRSKQFNVADQCFEETR